MSRDFEAFKEGLESDPPESREEAFALYGYYVAFATFRRITLEELFKLQELLGLSDDDVDTLSF